jgi:hypothetical protein
LRIWRCSARSRCVVVRFVLRRLKFLYRPVWRGRDLFMLGEFGFAANTGIGRIVGRGCMRRHAIASIQSCMPAICE